MKYRWERLTEWPGTSTDRDDRRWPRSFRADFMNTKALLDKELGLLDAYDVTVRTFHKPGEMRRDGLPMAGAKEPEHPGVILSADTSKGVLVWRTDVCTRWEHNLRSIGLGLERLRDLDRYGITPTGEQYAGFKALPRPGEAHVAQAADVVDEAYVTLAKASGWDVGLVRVDPAAAYRAAAKAQHPDRGGNPVMMAAVNVAWAQIGSR